MSVYLLYCDHSYRMPSCSNPCLSHGTKQTLEKPCRSFYILTATVPDPSLYICCLTSHFMCAQLGLVVCHKSFSSCGQAYSELIGQIYCTLPLEKPIILCLLPDHLPILLWALVWYNFGISFLLGFIWCAIKRVVF